MVEGERTGALASITSLSMFGNQPVNNITGKSVSVLPAGAASQIPIYVKYKDHAFFKNLSDPVAAPVIRETIGWVKEENEELFLIEFDRSVPRRGKNVNGIIILKNCIIEAYPLPLQKKSEYHLNLTKTTSRLELAFRPSERKTHGAKFSRKNQTC